MSTEQIPAAAIEAAARANYERHYRTGWKWDELSDQWKASERAIVTSIVEAAAPHLAARHPARVLPSVEDIEQRILPAWLAEHDAKVRAEALREAAEDWEALVRQEKPPVRGSLWLMDRARAAETEGE